MWRGYAVCSDGPPGQDSWNWTDELAVGDLNVTGWKEEERSDGHGQQVLRTAGGPLTMCNVAGVSRGAVGKEDADNSMQSTAKRTRDRDCAKGDARTSLVWRVVESWLLHQFNCATWPDMKDHFLLL